MKTLIQYILYIIITYYLICFYQEVKDEPRWQDKAELILSFAFGLLVVGPITISWLLQNGYWVP